MILDFLKHQPLLRKIFFRRQDESYQLFLQLSTRTEISGLSFFERQICLFDEVSMKEVQKLHESLSTKVDDFIAVAQEHYPNLHEITKTEAISSKSKVYAAKIFTYFDGFYFVTGVFFYQKLPNSNYWKRMEEPPATAAGRVEPHYAPPIYTGYPETFRFSFCGACGDVNYLQQSDMNFFNEKFYADSPIASDLVVSL